MKRSALLTLMLLLVFIFPEFVPARAGGGGGKRSRSSSRRRRSVRKKRSSRTTLRERRARRRRSLYTSRRRVLRRLNRLTGLNRVVLRLKFIAMQMDRRGQTAQAAALRTKIRLAEEKIARHRGKLYDRQRYLNRQIRTYGF